MTTLCNKYKPECFADVKGQEAAVEKINFFMKNFPKKKALILHGATGTGKTSLAYSLAQETNSEILELNASDLRNQEQIKKILESASQQAGLYKKDKILLVDEIDGITKDDRGGLPELVNLIELTNFPIIITANNIWDRKFSELRKQAEMIEIKELDYKTIVNILKEISEKENIQFPEDLLTSIAIKARGDVRAAINDLQTIDIETKPLDIHERDKEEKIFNALQKIFKNLPNNETLGLYEKVDMSLDEIFLWLEENIPSEYKGQELAKAYDALSKADVFRGRIHRQQHWRFLVYQNFLLSAGISASKEKAKTGFTIYKRPERILKIWMINQKFQSKKSISAKYADYCHISIKRAMKDFPIIKQVILSNKNIQKQLRLEENEIDYLGK